MEDRKIMSSKKLIASHYVPPSQATTFEALKELKEAQNHHNTIKNRISVLKVQDEKNIKKAETQQNKMNKILDVRDENNKDRERNKEAKLQLKKQTEKQRSLNKQIKDQQKSRVVEIKNFISDVKTNNFKAQCRRRVKNEQKIVKDKEDTMFKKKSMRNKIVEMEESCKDSILEFITRKNHTIHEGIFAERDVYLNKKKKKQRQVEKVTLLEMQMIKKHSESQMAYKETKNKLDLMLGNLRKENKQNKSKMKSVMKDKDPQTSFYGAMI